VILAEFRFLDFSEILRIHAFSRDLHKHEDFQSYELGRNLKGRFLSKPLPIFYQQLFDKGLEEKAIRDGFVELALLGIFRWLFESWFLRVKPVYLGKMTLL
tara:strand:- start:1894 stop:2196 length:303 start_codon:yes stop_codon:yes gene_type:complete